MMDQRCELDWLAFQYVAGEMCRQDCDVFERRLAEDQEAREAVASAVDLAQCTVAAETELTLVAPTRSSEPSFWLRGLCVAMSTASCLALFVAIHGTPGPERLFRPSQSPETASAALSELAIIWSESRDDWDEPLLSPEPPANELVLDFPGLDSEDAASAEEELSSDWIGQAVFLIGSGGDHERSDSSAERPGDAPSESEFREVSTWQTLPLPGQRKSGACS